MQEIVNKHQLEAWNGYEGEHWARYYDRYDATNAGANAPLLEAASIEANHHVLDIGCGSGQVSRLAARIATSGRVTGIDLSTPMLKRAREIASAQGVKNVDFIQGDAQVHLFPECSFDVAISRFGIMFFSDPVEAFTNIRRALRPDGRLACVALGRTDASNEMMVPFLALADHMPHPESADESDPHGPASFSNPDVTRETLTSAGFIDIRVEPLQIPMNFGRDAEDAASFLIGWGPVRHGFHQAGVTDTEAARSAMVEALRPYETSTGIVLRGDIWLVSATRGE